MIVDKEIAEIIGIHIGDGCLSRTARYAEYYIGGDITEEREYHELWVKPLYDKKIMLPLLKREINYKAYPKVGVYGAYIFDNELVKLFESFGIKVGSKTNVEIPHVILKNKLFLNPFLRGLFDTDGNLYFDKNRSSKNPKNDRPIIKLGTVSKKLANQVMDLLVSIGMHPRMKKPYKGKRDKNEVYAVLIYRKNDILKFIQQIGFKNPKHVTKWEIYHLTGICKPKTTLAQRQALLSKIKKAY